MKMYLVVLGVVASLVAGVCRWASGVPHEVDGYARATAESVAERVADAIPVEIHDRKLDHEVSAVRQEIIDRQVQMNLSQRQIERLEQEVAGLTTGVAFVDLGAFNTVAALAIAVCKMLLVILFFMHVRQSSPLNKIVLAAGFFWLLILIALTLADFRTRDWTPTPPGWGAAS